MIGDVLQPTHLIFILVVALLVLGPKRLPEVGKSLGKGIRDFKGALSGLDIDEPTSSGPAQQAPSPHVAPVTAVPTELPAEAPTVAASPSSDVSPVEDSVADAIEVREPAPTAATGDEDSSPASDVPAATSAEQVASAAEQHPVASAPERTPES